MKKFEEFYQLICSVLCINYSVKVWKTDSVEWCQIWKQMDITEYLFMENIASNAFYFPYHSKMYDRWIHKQMDFVFGWNLKEKWDGEGKGSIQYRITSVSHLKVSLSPASLLPCSCPRGSWEINPACTELRQAPLSRLKLHMYPHTYNHAWVLSCLFPQIHGWQVVKVKGALTITV